MPKDSKARLRGRAEHGKAAAYLEAPSFLPISRAIFWKIPNSPPN